MARSPHLHPAIPFPSDHPASSQKPHDSFPLPFLMILSHCLFYRFIHYIFKKETS